MLSWSESKPKLERPALAPFANLKRQVCQLQWAELAERAPHHPPKRLRGSKARGVPDERKFQRMISSNLPSGAPLFHSQWIEFEDLNGPGYAQPDCFLELRSRIICFECKLTETLAGYSQLHSLYGPLLRE